MAAASRRTLLLGAAVFTVAAPALAREVADATGRRIAVPGRVGRVLAAGPPASILLWSLAPEVLVGWPGRGLRPAELAFMPPEAASLPETGRLTGRDNTANLEAVLAQRPDLVLDYGGIGPTYLSLAERVRTQTGLPMLLLDGRLPLIPETYRLLGDILDRAPAAAARTEAATRILAAATDAAERLRARGRPRVLYVRGPRGQETGLAGSLTSEIIEFAGAENVAASSLGGLGTISPEQVLAWNPDWVIAMDPAFPGFARQDPVWGSLAAVRAGQLVQVPALPYGWVDFPPSVNRLLGLVWLPVLFGAAPADGFANSISDLYTLLFHRRPEAAQLAPLLRQALPSRA